MCFLLSPLANINCKPHLLFTLFTIDFLQHFSSPFISKNGFVLICFTRLIVSPPNCLSFSRGVLKVLSGFSRAIISLSAKCAASIPLRLSFNCSFSKFPFHYSWSRWIFQQAPACSQIIIWPLTFFKCRLLNWQCSFTWLHAGIWIVSISLGV